MLFLGIFLILFGILFIVKPHFIWNITESWKSFDETEPSILYIWALRFGGIMFILAGLGSVIAAFLS